MPRSAPPKPVLPTQFVWASQIYAQNTHLIRISDVQAKRIIHAHVYTWKKQARSRATRQVRQHILATFQRCSRQVSRHIVITGPSRFQVYDLDILRAEQISDFRPPHVDVVTAARIK